MAEYTVKIAKSSMEHITAREELMLKSTTGGTAIDETLASLDGNALIIHPLDYAVLEIHNEKVKEGENTDYTKYIILDKDGTKYVTASENFMNTFIDIFETMKNSDEDYAVKVFRKESKNYKGKYFITCEII